MSTVVEKITQAILACLLICATLAWNSQVPSSAAEPPIASVATDQRVQGELQALYEFRSSDGPIANDRSGTGQPLDMRIADPKHVQSSAGGLQVVGKTMIHSEKPATRLIEAVKKSGALTIESWVRPAKSDQTGPARIVTLSRDSGERNFTLGQDGDKFEVRLRTTKTSTNGMPSLVSKPKSIGPDWTHVAYTFDRAGKAKLYVNGQLNVEQSVGGATSNWDGGFQLALAKELSGDRPWLGTFRLVAIYSRDLSSSEVEENFRAGSRTTEKVAVLI